MPGRTQCPAARANESLPDAAFTILFFIFLHFC
nr:hypothetical protein PECWAHUG_PECWAHUG_CDS_0012 [Microvirus sp.]